MWDPRPKTTKKKRPRERGKDLSEKLNIGNEWQQNLMEGKVTNRESRKGTIHKEVGLWLTKKQKGWGRKDNVGIHEEASRQTGGMENRMRARGKYRGQSQRRSKWRGMRERGRKRRFQQTGKVMGVAKTGTAAVERFGPAKTGRLKSDVTRHSK